MKTIIDLTHDIKNGMFTHPYDGDVKVYEDKILSRDGYYNSRLETGMHAGTHIDAPRHFLESNTFIGAFELYNFIGNGCLLDVRNQNLITYKDEYDELVKHGDIVLLYTGFSQWYGTSEYYDNFNNHPIVDKTLTDFFINKKIKILGMDMPKPDNYPFEVHKQLFENDIFIIENLTNLDKLLNVSRFEVVALPLKIRAEASIIRAIAMY
ncbi:cyclase family protein [Vallitalea okinawensis]|uniref:cyclase family protein n=1 Tax=Vallitalea okinawensis TaxID=2078660 RepID=UPI000CFE30C5|nr:cyclase family protein [Vallitalea okinawensis]